MGEKKVKIVFHEKYKEVYASDPAAALGRLDSSVEVLSKQGYEFIEPKTATEQDILLVHTKEHFNWVSSRSSHLFSVALLAAGGAIKAAQLAFEGEPAFGLIRPPGHHASRNSCWGFCWFNNIAVAIKRLIFEKKIKNALIIDFDLHFGDGTDEIFSSQENVKYHHMGSLSSLEDFLDDQHEFDIIGVSAGFDRYVNDWGGILSLEDYRKLGELLGKFAIEKTNGRIFSVLEGGYNHEELGYCIHSYIAGIESSFLKE